MGMNGERDLDRLFLLLLFLLGDLDLERLLELEGDLCAETHAHNMEHSHRDGGTYCNLNYKW